MDYDRLRKDVEDYYGTAMYGGFPVATMDLANVAMMTDDELVEEAEEIGLNLDNYLKKLPSDEW